MSFETAGYQLAPVLPEMVLAVGAMALLMLGAYRGQETARPSRRFRSLLLVVVGVLVYARLRASTSPSAAASSSTILPAS